MVLWRLTPALACVRIWKWIQKCNGLRFTIGSKTRKARKNAHGPVAIALGARQRARAFAFGNGFKNVMGSGSRLVLKPERLEKRTWSCGDRTRSTPARACVRIWKWIQKCSGLRFTIGSKNRKARTTRTWSCGDRTRSTTARVCVRIWKWIQKCNGLRFTIGSKTKKAGKNAHGPVAITLGTRPRACIRMRACARSTRA